MNKQRRKAIDEAVTRIEELNEQLQALIDDVGDLADAEDEYYENMPESLRSSQRGEDAYEASQALSEAKSCLDNVETELDSALEQLQSAAAC